jgi:protein-S-isoprenylcysteine O-methyltransferase Ste14
MFVKTIVLIECGACLGSFAWGMARHFHRPAKPSRSTALTGAIATACGVLQVIGLCTHQSNHPWAAMPLFAISLALFWWAVRVTRHCLAACGTGQHSQRIVRSGPYAWIRHPFYTSYNLAWVAGFMATRWWPLAPSTLVMACIYDYFACQEESAYLRGDLAAAYRRYRLRTGKYLPRL